MKLFKKIDRKEGDQFEQRVFLTVGKQFIANQPDGWYIKFELPFTFNKHYTNATTFEIEKGKCRYHWLYRRRKNGKSFVSKSWMPLKEK